MIVIKKADPRDFVSLLGASDAYMASLYPATSNHMLDVETLCLPQMRPIFRPRRLWRLAVVAVVRCAIRQ